MSAEPSTNIFTNTRMPEAGGGGRRGRRWARRYLYPPSGREVRRLVAVLMLAVGVPRLPVLHNLLPFAEPRFGPADVFGVAFVLGAVMLLATAYGRRLTLAGRLAAVYGVVCWVTLAAATSSATSFGVDLAVAAALLMEAGTLREH